MSASTQLIQDFCKAWSRLDPAELTGYFTEDGIYHNMPAGPVQGRKAIQDWEILNLAESGNVVIAERVDRTQAGDKSVDPPCYGRVRDP